MVSFKSNCAPRTINTFKLLIPQLIGPPGVGKTAILEGLASRIVSKEIPEVFRKPLVAAKSLTFGMVQLQSLQHKRVLSIDLAAIMAGSGIRGQFEEKFKALLRDIEDEVRLTLLAPQ